MIDKLEFFLAVARQQNFRRAAEECGVAQPSLSAGIKQLEETLGVMLIRRSSQFQGLTPEGERVLEWARRLVGDARAMREEIRVLKTGLSGVLRIAVIPSALPYTPTLTTPYRLLHPAVRMTILSRSSVDISEMLGSLQADAGITYLDSEATGRLHALPLYVEQYQLLTARTVPSSRQTVTWAEVATLPLCLLTSDMQNRRIIDRFLTAAAPSVTPPMIESDSMISLLSHVRHGDWATIVSAEVAAILTDSRPFRSVPINSPEAGLQVGFVVPDRHPGSPMVSALTAVVERLVREPPQGGSQCARGSS